jgi:hypothetical protein
MGCGEEMALDQSSRVTYAILVAGFFSISLSIFVGGRALATGSCLCGILGDDLTQRLAIA